jgi:uncharacterized NAD-dependent epimerase/dehydratase family protein
MVSVCHENRSTVHAGQLELVQNVPYMGVFRQCHTLTNHLLMPLLNERQILVGDASIAGVAANGKHYEEKWASSCSTAVKYQGGTNVFLEEVELDREAEI